MAGHPVRTITDSPQTHLDDHNALFPQLDVDAMAAAGNGSVLVKQAGVWGPGAVAAGTVMHPAIVVASADMPQAVKDNADYVCDGTADQEQINAAIEQAGSIAGRSAGAGPNGDDGEQRACVQLTGGRFNINAPILMRTGVVLAGFGRLTEIRAVSMTATGMVMLANTSVHGTVVRDFWLHGNYAAGGTTASGIHYVSATSGDNHNTYPPSGNDPENQILRLMVWGFKNNSNRHGIRIETDVRMTTVHGCYLREIGGHAIWFSASPDSAITDCHIGAVGGNGIYIQGANNRVANTKAFYCDGWGFESTSGYVQVSNVEIQDSANGFRFAGAHAMATGILADTIQETGIEVAANGAVIDGFQVAHRNGGRYSQMATGLNISGTPTNLILVGRVDTTNINTRIAGNANGQGNFVRVTGDNNLLSVG